MNKMMIPAMFLITCIFLTLTENGYSADIGDVQIHGYITQGYLKSSEYDGFIEGAKDGTFQFNETALTFSTYAADKLHLGAQFLAIDFGDIGNDEIVLDWAYADYHWKDYLGLRTGLIKIPHGLYNETRDVDMFRNNIFLPSSVYPETFRDAFTRIKGLGAYGAVPGGFSYQALYGVSDMKLDGKLTQNFAKRMGGDAEGVENDGIHILNVQWESLFGLKLGASYLSLDAEFDISSTSALIGDATIESKEMDATVGSIEYQYENLTLAIEYVLYNLEFFVESKTTSFQYTEEYDPEGYYASAAYRFTSWFVLGAYYSIFYRDKDNHDDAERCGNDLALTTRFDINENWVLKLEAHKMTGLFFALNEDGTQPTEAAGDEEDWYMYGAKLSFNF